MAGGIFVERPFVVNVKCLVFASVLCGILVLAPEKRSGRLVMAPFTFIFAYVAMAWYDYAYSCSDRMLSGRITGPWYGSIFKPQYDEQQQASQQPPDLVPDQKREYMKRVWLFHVLIITPLLGYVAWAKTLGSGMRWAIGELAVLAGLYHGFRLWEKGGW